MRTKVRTARPKTKMKRLASENLRRASHYATNVAILDAKEKTRAKIKSVGLGKLSNAVGATSSLQKRRPTTQRAWGALYARGGINSRANQALSIYSEGGTITPVGGKNWLAWANERVIGRFGAGRKRMTPKLYNSSGLVQRLGRLVFIRTSATTAVLAVKNVTTSKRTGRSKAYAGKTPRGAVREKMVIAFFLIRYTRRAQRFDQGALMMAAAARIPNHVNTYQLQTAGSGGAIR